MGNRAVISFGTKLSDVGIYLHWNGGPESVLAFLEAAKQLGIRGGEDESYCFARLCQIIGNFFGGTLSLGIGPLRTLDCNNGDNGHYILNGDLTIAKRRYSTGASRVEDLPPHEQERYAGVLAETLKRNKEPFKGD